jgi:hypothetical protein
LLLGENFDALIIPFYILRRMAEWGFDQSSIDFIVQILARRKYKEDEIAFFGATNFLDDVRHLQLSARTILYSVERSVIQYSESNDKG